MKDSRDGVEGVGRAEGRVLGEVAIRERSFGELEDSGGSVAAEGILIDEGGELG